MEENVQQIIAIAYAGSLNQCLDSINRKGLAKWFHSLNDDRRGHITVLFVIPDYASYCHFMAARNLEPVSVIEWRRGEN